MNVETMENALVRLKLTGFQPKTVLDLGAHHGKWTEVAREVWPDAAYTMVDAIEYEEPKRLRIPYHNAVLNDIVTDVPWYEEKNTGDSMFKENTTYFKDTKPMTRRSTTLDIMFAGKTFDFIKIDCQGAEIPILKGGPAVIQDTEVILLEIPFAGQYNVGVPDFQKHIAFMDSIGFAPFDVAEQHRWGMYLIQIDIVFVRKTSPLFQTLQKWIENAK